MQTYALKNVDMLPYIIDQFALRVCDGPEWPERKHNAARPKPLHTHCSIGSPGPSWTPLRTPGAFVAPAATIFVSATYFTTMYPNCCISSAVWAPLDPPGTP